MNDYIDYYKKNKISPVRQDINDFDKHLLRRTSLLRQLSIHPSMIENKDILEVGPGGGYNALANHAMNPKSYTLVEPNEVGFKELKENFSKQTDSNNIFFHNCLLEEFTPNHQFDIVFCEGLVQGLENKNEFIKLLAKNIKRKGILVFTVADEITIFFETIRRYLANELTKDISSFDKRIEILVDLFSKDLNSLVNMTRRHDDWCADLMCDALYNHTISIKEAIELLKDAFFFLGSSPRIFQDFRWYKNIPHTPKEYNEEFVEQFDTMRHSLISSKLPFSKRESNLNNELSQLCKSFIQIIKALDKNTNEYSKKDLLSNIENIAKNLKNYNQDIDNALIEFIDLLKKETLNVEDIKKLLFLPYIFGKGQVFLSFERE